METKFTRRKRGTMVLIVFKFIQIYNQKAVQDKQRYVAEMNAKDAEPKGAKSPKLKVKEEIEEKPQAKSTSPLRTSGRLKKAPQRLKQESIEKKKKKDPNAPK